MNHRGYLTGGKLPDRRISPPGRPYGGKPIGILVAEAHYAMLPGNVANAYTYPFPVEYHQLQGVSFERIVAGDPEVADAVIEGGQQLEQRGVRAIFGACGSFANYQQAVAAALDTPVYLSSMLQVPWVLSGLPLGKKLLVISAVKSALTDRVFAQCGIVQPERLIIEQAIDLPAFEAMLSPEGFNPAELESGLRQYTLDQLRKHPEAGAVLLQCSDLPPFAHAIQAASGLPVFDMNTLVQWVYSALVRLPYEGII